MRIIANENYKEGEFSPPAIISFGQVECVDELHGYLAVKIPLPLKRNFTMFDSDGKKEYCDKIVVGFLLYIFRKGTFGLVKPRLYFKLTLIPYKYF